jgi:PAS domain S-box-containing protein
MSVKIRILQVEDSESDAALIERLLEKAGYAVHSLRVENAGQMRNALAGDSWDLVVCDYRLPQFDAPAALKLLQESGLDIPFIVVSATIGEEVAVRMMKAGAHDYVMKNNLARLLPAIEREMREAHTRRERSRAERALEAARIEAESSHRLLNAVFTALTDGVLVFDADGLVIRTNPAGEAFFGFDPRGLDVMQVREQLHLAGGFDSSVTLRALSGETVINAEQIAGDRVIEASSAPMRDPAGRIRGAVTVCRNITERKRAEERLQQFQKLESIGVLAGGIAHDFNNILAAVNCSISLVIQELRPGSHARDLLDTANVSIDRAAALIRQLLAYAGKGAFARESVSASAVAEDTIKMLRPTLPEWIELRDELEPDVPNIIVDSSQLEQVFLNLILNAVEAIPDHNPGVVTVATSCRDGYVHVEVSDNGCGMDEATRKRMFDPFFTTKFVGRGLGLAAVDGIVRSLRGSIVVDSTPGLGTHILALLPAAGNPQQPWDEESLKGSWIARYDRNLAPSADQGQLLES